MHNYDIKLIIQEEISYLPEAFPAATFIWIDMLPRKGGGKYDLNPFPHTVILQQTTFR